MNFKSATFAATALLALVAGASVVSAQDIARTNLDINLGATRDKEDVTVQTSVKASVTTGNATSSAAKTTIRGNATSTTAKDTRGNATSPTASAEGKLNAEMHRSEVASLVKSLLSLADRQGGIGAEVRVVAQEQSASATTTAAAIEKAEKKGKISTFLFGSDYKSLGELRSSMTVTTNSIERLTNLLDRTIGSSDKAELQLQIDALKATQAEVSAFIETKESSFSLFGWLIKPFAN